MVGTRIVTTGSLVLVSLVLPAVAMAAAPTHAVPGDPRAAPSIRASQPTPGRAEPAEVSSEALAEEVSADAQAGPCIAALPEAALPGFGFKFVANATVEASRAYVSASTLGLHVPVPVTPTLALAPYVRALLPTESLAANATRYGFEQGIALVADLHPLFELTGGYAAPLRITSVGTVNRALFTPTFALDGGLRPWSWLEVMAGAQLRMVPQNEDAPIEGLGLRTAVRLYPHGGMLIDIGSTIPLAGRDRRLAAFGLSLGWVAVP